MIVYILGEMILYLRPRIVINVPNNTYNADVKKTGPIMSVTICIRKAFWL